MRKRIHQVKFRLDDDELMLLRRKLRESNLSMAEFFRRLLVDGEIRIYPNAFVADLQKQVKGVGRNVNQITRLAHISGKVSLETLRQISAAQEKIEQQLERLNYHQYAAKATRSKRPADRAVGPDFTDALAAAQEPTTVIFSGSAVTTLV